MCPLDTNTLVKLDKYRFFEDSVIIVLDKLFDIANIGSIMRTASAFGVRNLIVLKKFFPDENSYLSSIASGALEKVQILKVSSLHKTVKLFQKSGWWIVGLESKNLPNCINIQSNKNKYNKTILILGSEREGIRPLIRDSCDFLVRIPMKNNSLDSINVSVAAGIALYEITNNKKD